MPSPPSHPGPSVADTEFSRLVAGLRDGGWDISGEELADALWLAQHLGFEPVDATPEPLPDPNPPPPDRKIPDPPPGEIPPDRGGLKSPTPPADKSETGFPGGANLGIRNQLKPDSGLALGTASDLTLRTPAGRALPGSREFARALRPLRRRVPSPTRRVFDEEETIRRIADERLWAIVERPARERWLDLALVVDDGPTMVLWRETIRELRRCLEHAGLFRDVRIWTLDTAGREPVLRSAPRAASRPPGELLGAAGRRLILVVSDTLGAAWNEPGMARVLDLWGRNQILALAHLLPERLWDRTPLAAATRLRVGPPFAGVSNRGFTRHPWQRWDLPPGKSGLAVPVFSLNPPFANASTWSRVIAGDLRARTAALLHPAPRMPTAPPSSAPRTARELVDSYHTHASSLAWRLAQLLASAPLRLSVMRVVQSALLPDSGQAHLAEFLFSDLLVRSGQQPGGNDPDALDHDFRPGVRDLLLRSSNAVDTVRVQTAVGEYVRNRYGAETGFAAILANPGGATVDTAMGRHPDTAVFAQIAAELLQRLGGAYAAAADRAFGKKSGDAPAEPVRRDRPGPRKAPIPKSRPESSPKPAVPSILPETAAHAVTKELRRMGVRKADIAGLLAARTPEAWAPFTKLPGFWALGSVGLFRLVQAAAGLQSVRDLRIWRRDGEIARDTHVGLKPEEALPPRSIADSQVGSAFLDSRSVAGRNYWSYLELATPVAAAKGPVDFVLTVDFARVKGIPADQRIPAEQIAWIEALARVFGEGKVLAEDPSLRLQSAAPLAGKRILWVDDGPEGNQRYVRDLRKLGPEIIEVLDTSTALDRLANDEPSLRFDAVISDLRRGNNPREGLAMLAAMRQRGLNHPVGFFSWVQGLKLQSEALAAGAYVCTNRFTEVKRRLQEVLAEPAPSTPPAPPIAKPTAAPYLPLNRADAVRGELIRWGVNATDAESILTDVKSEAWSRLWRHQLSEERNAWWADLTTLAVLAVSMPKPDPDGAPPIIDVVAYHGEGSFYRIADGPRNSARELFATGALHSAFFGGNPRGTYTSRGRPIVRLGDPVRATPADTFQLAIPIVDPGRKSRPHAVLFIQSPMPEPFDRRLVEWLSRAAFSLAVELSEKLESDANQPDEGRAEMESGATARSRGLAVISWVNQAVALPRWQRLALAVRAARRMMDWAQDSVRKDTGPSLRTQLAMLEMMALQGSSGGFTRADPTNYNSAARSAEAATELAWMVLREDVSPSELRKATLGCLRLVRDSVRANHITRPLVATLGRLLQEDLQDLLEGARKAVPEPQYRNLQVFDPNSLGDLWREEREVPTMPRPLAQPTDRPERWILIAGLGNQSIPSHLQEVSSCLGTLLAASGCGLIAGGWPGVDTAVTEAFVRRLAIERRTPEGWLRVILEPDRKPEVESVPIEIASSVEDSIARSVAATDAVILISGRGGTARIGRTALAAGKLVLPLRATGGDAENFYPEARAAAERGPLAIPAAEFDAALGGSWQESLLRLPLLLTHGEGRGSVRAVPPSRTHRR